MLRYSDGIEVRVGDRVRHEDFDCDAVVETVIEGESAASLGLEGTGEISGVMLIGDKFGRLLIESDPEDWEEVAFVGRAI